VAADGAVYVYAVLPAAGRPTISAKGIDDCTVDAVEHEGVAALTSALRREALTARDLRAHWRVIEEAFEHGTLLPLRFGMVMESEQAVRDRLLAANVEQLTGLLEQMAGLVQLTVKGDYDEERLLREVVQQSPGVAAMRERVRKLPEGLASQPERMRLGELVADAVARRRDQDTRLALEVLEPHAVSVSVEEVANAGAAFNLAFLVNRDQQGAFGEAVARLRQELDERVAVRYVGPLPPYSFTEADLSAGSAAWA
jgi:hypothetical protein